MVLLAKAWRYYRNYGFREFVNRIHRRRLFVVFVKNVDAHSRISATYPDVVFRVAESGEKAVLEWMKTTGDDMDEEVGGIAASDSRQLVIVGTSRTDLASPLYISLVSRRDRLFSLLPCALTGSNDACSRRIWVAEHARRRSMASRGLQFTEYAAHKAGVERLWAFVLRSNRASIALHRRLGYREVGMLRVGRCLGKRIAQFRGVGGRHWQELSMPKPSTTCEQ